MKNLRTELGQGTHLFAPLDYLHFIDRILLYRDETIYVVRNDFCSNGGVYYYV